MPSNVLVSLTGKTDAGAIETLYKAKPMAFNAAIFTSVLYVLLVVPFSVMSFFSENTVTNPDGSTTTTTHDMPWLAVGSISIPILLVAYGMFFDAWSKHTKRFIISKEDHREHFKEWKTRKTNQGQNPKPVWIGAIQTTNDLLADYTRLLLIHAPGDIHHETLTAALETTIEINEENIKLYRSLEPVLDSPELAAGDDVHVQTDKLIQEVEQLIELRDQSATLYVRSRADMGHNIKLDMRFDDIKHKLDGLLEAGDLAIVSGASAMTPGEREVIEARIEYEKSQELTVESDMRGVDKGVAVSGKSEDQVWQFGWSIQKGITEDKQGKLGFDWDDFNRLYDAGDLDTCMEMCLSYAAELPNWQREEKARLEREERQRKEAAAAARRARVEGAKQFIMGDGTTKNSGPR